MTYLDGEQPIWMARTLGAFAGSAVSIIYMLPKGHKEAASRFVTGLVAGLVFGGPAGIYAAEVLGLLALMSRTEILLSGSALVSLTAWWGLGALARMAEKWGR